MSFVATNRKPISHYRPPPRERSAPPDPPRWLPRAPTAPRPPLWHFVLLSMLLHVLAILLFGAPTGGSREGRAMWGSLDVVIKGAAPEAAPNLKLETRVAPAPAAPKKRAAPPKAAREPPPAPAAAPLELKRETVIPPMLERITPPERNIEMVPVPKIPPPSVPEAVATPPVERPAIEAPALPSLAPPPTIAPVEVKAVPVPPVERAPIETPTLPSLAPAPTIAPVEVKTVPVPPMERAPIETPALPALAPAPTIAPVEVKTVPVPPVERARIEAPSVPAMAPTPRIEAPPAPVVEPPAARPAQPAPPEVRSIERAPSAQPSVRPAPKTEGEAPSPFRAAPPRPQEYDQPKSLDLDAIKRRANEMAREGSGQRALLPFPMPPVPPKKSKMEEAIEKARKPDCRDAYKDLGLAAVVPLIANEFGEGTCRW